ncbi:MAG: glycoside hydrolase family 15 protein [Bacteroidota bacterium]
MSYLPIEDYGIIGNMRSAALIGTNASIDWFCFPHFDSPSVFARLLDSEKGGYFRIQAKGKNSHTKQFYWPDTNVLITRLMTDEGIVEIMDYMPVGSEVKNKQDYKIVRKLKSVHGDMLLNVQCHPAFNYARDDHETVICDKGASFYSPTLSMALSTAVPLTATNNGVDTDFILKDGDSVVFIFHELDGPDASPCNLPEDNAEQQFKNTIDYWRKWLSKSTYKGRWREMVNRSVLTLKLLTFEPTGAIVAAPTCSLPEGIGGERNWDYRYTWIRDAAFTVYAFLRVGFTEEADRFMDWVIQRSDECRNSDTLQIMYGVDGRHTLTEETLDHLSGYKNSKPVRIGNGAYDQLQLDIYGELMDSVYLYNKYGSPISHQAWKSLSKHLEWVCEHWDGVDEGIWEVRSGRQRFVYSKVMCWVALDRGIRLAQKRSFPADIPKWARTRDKIYNEVMEKGWNKERKSFIQYYGSDTLDASNLMMPLVFFIAPNDPMMISTLKETLKSPDEGGLVMNSLVYRYNVHETEDGLSGHEGTFNICTFWLVEALTRSGKTKPEFLEHARLVFEQMLGYANHLGIYSEEISDRGEALGNTPQAFTHLALISAAYNLDKALG